MNKITVEETKALCEKYGVLLLAYHADRFERLGALIDDLRATQPPQDERGQLWGEKEISDLILQREHREEIIDALCDAVLGEDRPEWSSAYYFEDAVSDVQERIEALEVKPAQPVALSTLTDERLKELWDHARTSEGMPYLTFARAILAASAPAQQAATSQPVAAEGVKDVIGWATHHDEPMLFPTREEALQYCDEDEEPIALVAASQDSAKETK